MRLIARACLCAALILTGLSAGFFFTYEASVTLGLMNVDDETYVKTFQSLNATIRNPYFGIVFFGAMVTSLLATLSSWRFYPRMKYFLTVAVVLHLICLTITLLGNVPLNNELATVTTITDTNARAARIYFEERWNNLNLLRTLAIVTGFGFMVLGAVLSSSSALGSLKK